MAITPKYKPAINWQKERRFKEAVKKHLDEGWSQAKAAQWYGISRPRLNEHVRNERERREKVARGELAGSMLQAAIGPMGLQENRRVGTFEEFDRRYFGHWVCPDCSVHHEMPEFHREIAAVCQDSSTRAVINVPPYHSKSTNVTVKDTIYDLVRSPNSRTLIVSKSLDFARGFLGSIDQLLTNPMLYEGAGGDLIKEWGPFKPEGDSSIWNRDQIYVAGRVTAEKDATVQVRGVGGQVYGRRADKIKCDDIADLKNQRNPAMVQQMLEWLDKELSSRIGKSGKLMYVGTRVHPGDIYSVLKRRAGYKVLQYPAILDEATESTLWPDHFDFQMALAKREEMRDSDFQLVYQNIDVPGLGASFTEEMMNTCKDTSRAVGHYLPEWRLIAGLDLAGGNAGSGYTAGVLKGIDLRTGKRFYVDCFNIKSMKAPQLKQQMFEWTERYPIYEWRVENNGLQSNLVQYNEEIIRVLAQKGVRVVGHNTQSNKWDAEFGVESSAPLFSAELQSIPWGNAPSARVFQQLIDQLLVFPMGMQSDLAMADWFAELGLRDLLRRAHLPMFNERMRVPERIRRNRRVVDFSAGEVRRIPRSEQRGGQYAGAGSRGYRRLMVGTPSPHRDVIEAEAAELTPFTNVGGFVEDAEA